MGPDVDRNVQRIRGRTVQVKPLRQLGHAGNAYCIGGEIYATQCRRACPRDAQAAQQKQRRVLEDSNHRN